MCIGFIDGYMYMYVWMCSCICCIYMYVDMCAFSCVFLLFICIKKMCVLKKIHKVRDKNCLDICFFCVEDLLSFFLVSVSISVYVGLYECFMRVVCVDIMFVCLFVCLFMCLGLTFVYDGFNNFMMVFLTLHIACWHCCC